MVSFCKHFLSKDYILFQISMNVLPIMENAHKYVPTPMEAIFAHAALDTSLLMIARPALVTHMCVPVYVYSIPLSMCAVCPCLRVLVCIPLYMCA